MVSTVKREETIPPAKHTDPKYHWLDLGFRILTAIGLLYCALTAARNGIAHYYSQHPSQENLVKAIYWAPSDPALYSMLGHIQQEFSEDIPPHEIITLFKTAAHLSPRNAYYWSDLGSAYEWAGLNEEAHKAFGRALGLFPRSPKMNWWAANYFLRNGQFTDAMTALRRVLQADPSLRRQVYDLAWRSGMETPVILRDMIPRDVSHLFLYLNYLSRTNRPDESTDVWRTILDTSWDFDPKLARPYLNLLIRERRISEATEAWTELFSHNPYLAGQRDTTGENLVHNGSFENPVYLGGLGWRVSRAQGTSVSRDSFTFFEGTKSVRIRFDGRQNPFYRQLFQFVAVKPRTTYFFSGYLKSKDVTTDARPHFAILDADEPAQLRIEADSVLPTQQWTPYELEIHTGARTRLVLIRVERHTSRRIDSDIAGDVWVDNLSLVEQD